MAEQQSSSGPWPLPYASLGGRPTVSVDIAVCAVFLTLFIAGAAGHMTVFQLNKRRGHKFLLSGMLFGFCMARITANVLRIAWATRPNNIRLGIAASIFLNAGVILLFIINLIFTQRLLRAAHPHMFWHSAVNTIFNALIALIIISITMLIIAVIQSFYTLNTNTRRIDHDIQLYGQTYFAFVATLPIPLIIMGLILPRRSHVEKFGTGRWRSKVRMLLASSVLLAFGAWWRAATNMLPERLVSNPAWYQSKAAFYCVNFGIEIIIVYFYLLLRVDRRFHVPDGASQAGDYAAMYGDKKNGETTEKPRAIYRIRTEEEILDEGPEQEAADEEAERAEVAARTENGDDHRTLSDAAGVSHNQETEKADRKVEDMA